MKKKNIIVVFLVLLILNIVLSYFHHVILNLDFLEIEKVSNVLKQNQIDDISEKINSNEYLNFIIIAVIIFIKVFFVSSIIFFGAFLYNSNLSFKKILALIIKLEYIFLLTILFEIIYFKYINTTATINDIQYFYPLSALNIVGYKGLDAWFIYPLQVLNLFELTYWLLLSYFIGKMASPTKNGVISKYPIDFGLKIVATSYGSALLLWVVVVMFFTLNYS